MLVVSILHVDIEALNDMKNRIAQSAPIQTIDIVFDGPPSHQSGRFVEVENAEGHSIRVGEWLQRPDSYWVLRLKAEVKQ